MATKCIKLAGEYVKENSLEKDKFFKELRDIQYKTWLACNRAITYYYSNDMQNFIQKDVGIPKEDDKLLYGKAFKSWVANRISEILGDGISSYATDCISQFVSNRYKNDKKAGLLKGNVALSQFKRDIPVMLRERAYSIIDTPKGLGIEISFFSKTKQQELGIKRILFTFPKIDGSSKSILTRIMDKTYKQGSIQITYNKRKKKWMFAISYTFENKLEKVLDDNLVMGIDLGITKVATMSIYDIEKHKYKEMYWKDQTIDGTELIHYRQKIEARRKSLSIASKWASDNAIGHGYKRRMKKANNIGDKYNRFKDTYNHKVSRYIVDLAYKHGVKTIQMEDLSGFSEHQSESLLKNWSYYDLQNKIKYKAEEKGINTIFINPQYTSKRCSKCGNIHEENRYCKNNQAKFECIICGHKENADINASKNIAIPYIDKIIKEYIKDTI